MTIAPAPSRLSILALLTVAFALCAIVAPVVATAATLVVGKDAPIRTVAEAAERARDGDTVEILSGEYAGDVTVWLQKRLTIRGIGRTPVLRADSRSAEGKAIWVFRDGDFVVENIAFEGARVAGLNGAGIRFERGKLTVRRCRFTDNENGLLTANFADNELTIEDSEFSRAPHDRGSLKHLLYVGRIGRFTLTGSRFHQGFEGHLVKSRAREKHISYNLLYDGPDGRAAYELEFPDGGIAYVVGNVIGQSSATTNTAVVAVNTLTIGPGLFALGARGRFHANFPVLARELGDSAALDFRLGPDSPLHAAGVVPPVVDGRSLAPEAEFELPIGTTRLIPRNTWTPGAFQSTDARR